MEIVGKHAILEIPPIMAQHTVQNTSGIGNSCQTLQRSIPRLVGNIPEMDMPDEWDEDIEIKYEWVEGHADDLNRDAT
jgi:hypothetical protein